MLITSCKCSHLSPLGPGAGFFPAWDAKLKTGDDWQTSVFYRHLAGKNDEHARPKANATTCATKPGGLMPK